MNTFFFAKAKNTRAHARDLGAIYWSIADTLSANLNQKRPVLADCEPNEYTYLSCTGTHSHADVSHPGEHFEVGLSAHIYVHGSHIYLICAGAAALSCCSFRVYAC